LDKREQAEVDYFRDLRERFHNGPFYTVVNAASTSARQGTKERAQFDPFHGMPSYSTRYQKRKRTIPIIAGREYSESLSLISPLLLKPVGNGLTHLALHLVVNFFPREMWPIVQPNYKPDQSSTAVGLRHRLGQFEDDEEGDDENDEEGRPSKRQKDENDDEEPDDEENEDDEALQDDDFSEDDDEMGGDYNAEQYFDAGDDEGDGDGFGDGGGGGGDDDYY
jgi:DNA-directed RNA polymerase III subunit RPC7